MTALRPGTRPRVGKQVGLGASDIQRLGCDEGQHEAAVDGQALGAAEVVLAVAAERIGKGEHHVSDGFPPLAMRERDACVA